MKFYDQTIVKQVRKYRRKGYSLRALEKKFKVPNTTISRWVRDIESDDPNFKRARAKERAYKAEFSYLSRNIKVNKESAKVLTSLLYWCEGSKHPAVDFVAFSNSDPGLVKTFLQLFRTGFNPEESKIRAHLQVHTTHKYNDIVNYWSGLLNIPVNHFYKPTITKPTRRMKRRNYCGTCTVRYYNVKLLLQIIGIFESISNRF